MIRVYLAGPEVFLPKSIKKFDNYKKYMKKLGFEAVCPFDGKYSRL